MGTLFAISMLCFFALLAAVLALVKKVYQTQRLLAASRQIPHEPVVEHTITGRTANPEPETRPLPRQNVQDLAPRKLPDWRFMVHQDRSRLTAAAPRHLSGTRKPPRSSHFGTHERLDWAYFNKDLGDLSDPYEPARSTGTSPLPDGSAKLRN